MTTVIIDYDSGNLHSAEKSFQRMAAGVGSAPVLVTSDPDQVRAADRIVLPGVGAFADCSQGLSGYAGLFESIAERVKDGTPFMGICVGMQLLASIGREHGLDTKGFDWISGEVIQIEPNDAKLKIPHMGWNELKLLRDHTLFEGISDGDHAYFVHSYHMKTTNESQLLATVDYGGPVTAVVGRDNIIGTQFHPEKSQKTGLQFIENFLRWKP